MVGRRLDNIGCKDGVDVVDQVSLLELVAEGVAALANKFGGVMASAGTKISAGVRRNKGNSPNQSKEEVQMINLRDLVDERRDTLAERFGIMVHNDIEVDSVFPTCKEGLSIIPASSENNQSGCS